MGLARHGDEIMSTSAKSVLQEALRLSPGDRAALVEGLIGSLDQPDPTMDSLWLKEAEDRMAAYRSGELGAVDAEKAFSELGQPI
jgi:putative addiction module component (TIGR02574 family)